MKKLIIVLFMIISLAGYSQTWISQPTGETFIFNTLDMSTIAAADTSIAFYVNSNLGIWSLESNWSTITGSGAIGLYRRLGNLDWELIASNATDDITATDTTFNYWATEMPRGQFMIKVTKPTAGVITVKFDSQ